MNKDSFLDYFSCILFRSLGPVLRFLPTGVSLFLGRLLGDLFYYFDPKHRAVVYSHIKFALGQKLALDECLRVTKSFYRNFGQNLIEIFLIPKIDRKYFDKYIRIEGLDYVNQALAVGKGVIFAAVHEGSWELYNIISANLGLPFYLFVRNQRYPKLNRLLNEYRIQKGCKIIQRQELPQDAALKSSGISGGANNELYGARKLIEALKNNESIGMTIDQGGKTGILVNFLGGQASMASGTVRFALKYGATILPTFLVREKGARQRIIVDPPFQIISSGDFDKDLRDNLQRLAENFERHIEQNPSEYLWSYKIWKHSREKAIVVLSDGKTGHLRQSQAVLEAMRGYLEDKGFSVSTQTLEVRPKSRLAKLLLPLCACLCVKYRCQSCFLCFKMFLEKNVSESLIKTKADIVISCGSQVAAVSHIFSKALRAKSIAVMRPSVLSMGRFDMVIMPRHDFAPRRKNVVETEGALNLISPDYLKVQSDDLLQFMKLPLLYSRFYIGLLIGGDTKDFCLRKEQMAVIIQQVKSLAEKENALLLVTTSRRTSVDIERLVSEEFTGYARCKLLVIANKNNLPCAVGGILGLSKAVVVSPESISMASEAASSGGYVVVFKSAVSRRHGEFLNYLAGKKYIYFVEPPEVSDCVSKLLAERPQ
ncbi:MAG: ELM1/GtrOC1 family putative glycosyltransferase, partial [Candidatus Omnitrophota bacterium]